MTIFVPYDSPFYISLLEVWMLYDILHGLIEEMN